MSFDEILQGIIRHRGNPATIDPDNVVQQDIKRKLDELEWAVHALALGLAEQEGGSKSESNKRGKKAMR